MEKPRSRLGRGLGSLLNVGAPSTVEIAVGQSPASNSTLAAAQSSNAVLDLPTDQIHPNPHQPRRLFNADRLRDLAASFKTNGIVQPIIVRRHEDGYQLIAGERRLRAAKLANLTTVPAIVRDASSFEQAQLALIENIQREDLNPIERAQSYQALVQQLGLTQAELANRLGEDRSIIANHLRLLQLPTVAIDLIASGQLSLGHGKILAGAATPIEQERLAKLAVDQELSVRNLERLIANSQNEPISAQPRALPATAHRDEVERSLSRQLDTRVQMQFGNKGKGKLLIHFESLDAFEKLIARMNCKLEAE